MENLYYILSLYIAICFFLGTGLWLFLKKKSVTATEKFHLKRSKPDDMHQFSPQLRKAMRQLSKQGKNPEEIARSLHRPTADIELALQLDRLIAQRNLATHAS